MANTPSRLHPSRDPLSSSGRKRRQARRRPYWGWNYRKPGHGSAAYAVAGLGRVAAVWSAGCRVWTQGRRVFSVGRRCLLLADRRRHG
jgi:hypothetical protein